MAEPKKILIVDDEPDMCEWLSTFIEDHGYRTIVAYDGFAGMEKAVSEKPDLITLDITMEKESGVKMFRRINEEGLDIPVIMITGVSPDFKNFIEGRKHLKPPAAYFEKPVDKEQLLRKIRELIG